MEIREDQYQLLDKLKIELVTTYRKFGEQKALIIGKLSYTGNEIATEIENQTELGINMINNIIQLTVELLKRDKINITK